MTEEKERVARGRPRRWSRRRTEIIRAAETTFARHGFAGARLEDIAASLGMQRPSLIYYFPDKRELYDATIGGIVQEIVDRLRAAGDGDDIRAGMDAITLTWIDFAAQRPDAARLLLRQLLDEELPRSLTSRAPVREMMELIRGAIDRGVRAGLFRPVDPVQFALSVAGMSLLWASARGIAAQELDYDTLQPAHLASYRNVILRFSRDLLEAGD